MKKLNKIVLNKAKVMTAPQMIQIVGGRGDCYDSLQTGCTGGICITSNGGVGFCTRGLENTACSCKE